MKVIAIFRYNTIIDRYHVRARDCLSVEILPNLCYIQFSMVLFLAFH